MDKTKKRMFKENRLSKQSGRKKEISERVENAGEKGTRRGGNIRRQKKKNQELVVKETKGAQETNREGR